MTDKPNNPLAMRRQTYGGGDGPSGRDFDAQAWCNLRNAYLTRNDRFKPEDHVEWYVAGTRESPQVRMRYIDTTPDGWPYCTPHEAREILRANPSSFTLKMLEAIEARGR